jgi:hypothetical protein
VVSLRFRSTENIEEKMVSQHPRNHHETPPKLQKRNHHETTMKPKRNRRETIRETVR